MEILITFAILLAIGTVVLKVTKNLISVGLVLLVGWGVWVLVSPSLVPSGTSLPDAAKELGEGYSDTVMNDLDKNTRDLGERLANKVGQDLDEQWDAAERGGGIEAWKVEDGPREIQKEEVHEEVESAFSRFITAVKTIFARTFTWDPPQ